MAARINLALFSVKKTVDLQISAVDAGSGFCVVL
jgi:hypothetical protein